MKVNKNSPHGVDFDVDHDARKRFAQKVHRGALVGFLNFEASWVRDRICPMPTLTRAGFDDPRRGDALFPGGPKMETASKKSTKIHRMGRLGQPFRIQASEMGGLGLVSSLLPPSEETAAEMSIFPKIFKKNSHPKLSSEFECQKNRTLEMARTFPKTTIFP